MPNTENIGAPSTSEGPFTLEYTSVAQQLLGHNIQRISSTLRLNSQDCTAFLERHRSQTDQPGEPIGTFQAVMSDSFMASVLGKIKTTNLAELPPQTGDGPGSTVITLKFQQGDHQIEQVFTTGDMQILEAVEDLLDALDALSAQMNNYPLAALKASLKVESHPQWHFVLTLTNIGRNEICLQDPRLIQSDDPDYWAGVQVAVLPVEQPGVTSPPLEWKRVPLEMPPETVPSDLVVLKPGDAFSAKTRPWTTWQTGKRFIALGLYSDYTGPGEVSAVYHIRGATFSDALEFDVR